jgi:UDP-N-acetylglucosamine acyltransferase
MIGVHIGHDCVLEDKIVMSNYVQLSGHCKIGSGVWLSGMVLLHQFVTLGRWCYAAGLAGINRDVPPFVIISGHYPPLVRGVNKRGLARAGLTEEKQQEIIKAYKKLYREDGALLEKAKALAAEEGLDENVREMVDVIINSGEQTMTTGRIFLWIEYARLLWAPARWARYTPESIDGCRKVS